MKTKSECIDCSRDNFIKVMGKFGVSDELGKNYLMNFEKFLSEIDLEMTPPEIARKSHEYIREALGDPDPYLKDKKDANRIINERYDRLYSAVRNSGDPLASALKLAIAGNILDPVYSHGLDCNEVIEGAIHRKLVINDSESFLGEIDKAEKILYLLDNAGEIVMDRLFLAILEEEGLIGPDKVTLAVRGRPVINDALMEDARAAGLTEKYKVITTGDNVPGIVLKTSSDEFNGHFARADVIVSKGQGNYETLSGTEGRRIFFMLIAKCPVIASDLNVNIGDMVCKSAMDN
jgi:damage-control phosphatase, subfamily I